MNNSKQIKIEDLSEEMLDVLNAQAAVISLLAKRLGLTDSDLKAARYQSSAGFKRLQAKVQKDADNRQAFKEDQEAMAAWALDAKYMYANADEWKKAADVEWLVIVERNGSEHGQPHGLRYREPSQAELLKALAEYGKWVNSENPQYAGHRARSRKVLPNVKKKLAALLVA